MTAATPVRKRKAVAGKPGIWRRVLGAIGLGSSTNKKRSGAHYEAASTANKGRKGWTTSNAGPNAVGTSAPYLRARARDMARNDAHCARAVSVIAGNIAGSGIAVTARYSSDDKTEKARAELWEQLWDEWQDVADVEGVHTYGALEGLVARAGVEAGECFVIMRAAPELVAVGRVPLRLEILEADMLDETRNERTTDAGGRTVQGVEFDARGRRVAYWFHREHPGEGWPFGVGRSEPIRVPAEDVIHFFVPLRPRQVRGIPFLAPVLATKADLETFERAELARKGTEACVVAGVIPGDGAGTDDDEGLIPSVVDDDGLPVEDLQPRLILRLRNGKDIKFFSPQISANYDTYKRAMLQSFAVGVGLSYEWASGDLSQANYSSLRGGLIEFWRLIEQYQYAAFIPKVTARVAQRFTEAAYLGGLFPRPTMPLEYTAPARQSVDPARESLGDLIDVRAGFVPYPDKVSARGYSPRKVLDQAASLQRELELLGVILDINPATSDFRGAMRNDRNRSGGGGAGAPPDDADDGAGESAP